jgi:hypothetical protein
MTVINERAVAVAKDVLEHLGVMNVEKGAYVRFLSDGYSDKRPLYESPLYERKGDLQDHLDEVQEKCEVCALGACLLSKARLYDNIDMRKFVAMSPAGFQEIRDMLNDIFDPKSMDLIETAFEKARFDYSYYAFLRGSDEYRELDEAIRFGQQFNCPKRRVTAVMLNIIKNNGFFRPWEG